MNLAAMKVTAILNTLAEDLALHLQVFPSLKGITSLSDSESAKFLDRVLLGDRHLQHLQHSNIMKRLKSNQTLSACSPWGVGGTFSLPSVSKTNLA